MFKIVDVLQTSDIFNEILKKRFEDSFSRDDSSRLWIIPNHIVFTTSNDTKVHTCDARPYDFSISPSESESDELLATTSSVLDIFFDTESASSRMFIVLINGDVQIFEYRTVLHEWARIGYFNVNIVSPNSNNHHAVLTQVLISRHQNMIYWSQNSSDSDTHFDLFKRDIPMNSVREITQSSIGTPKKLLKNCPPFSLVEIRDSICIVPKLPNNINLYIILSVRAHIWLFGICGKLLWRGLIGDNPIDFVSLCTKTVGLWKPSGFLKVCSLMNFTKNHAYLLHNTSLLSILPNGEIHKTVEINLEPENVKEIYIQTNCAFIASADNKSLHIYDINDGEIVQNFNLVDYSPIKDIWCHSSSIPSIGFYSKNKIYKISFKSLNSLLVSEPPCILKASNLLKHEDFHAYALLKDVIHHNFEKCDVPPMKAIPKVLQSNALLLAVLQSCREKEFKSDDFPVKHMKNLLLQNGFPETKLKDLLKPITASFTTLEKRKELQFDPKTVK